MNSSPGRPSSIQADGDVALVPGDAELVGDRLPRVGQPLAARGRPAACPRPCRSRSWSTAAGFLRAVAIDGQGLETQPPAFAGRRRRCPPACVSRGMFTVLEMAPERNGWAAAIIRTWACQANRAACRCAAGRHSRTPAGARSSGRRPLRSCPRWSMWATIESICGSVVTQRPQRQRHRLVDDLQHAAAGQVACT